LARRGSVQEAIRDRLQRRDKVTLLGLGVHLNGHDTVHFKLIVIARRIELGPQVVDEVRHPKVKRLVYITAFAPDAGESVSSLIANPPPGAPVPPILPPNNGFLFLDKAKFAASFAADVEPQKADFMARSQVPWGLDALQGAATDPAWKSKPSFYLVATQYGMIPPPAQRMMAERAGATVREEAGSHAIYVSKPQPVADIIEAAAG
jgi:hypothetical protein